MAGYGEPLKPRRRTPTRPYARKRNQPPSVTTILGALGGKNLEWGAAKETAIEAVLNRAEYVDLPDADAIELLRRHFRGVWDGRAAVGTIVHTVNEAWTWGEEAEYPAHVEDYVEGLARFWHDFEPVTVATEEVVRHVDKTLGYIGQRDWTAEIGGERWLIDLKTTAQLDPSKGLYFDSWRLQLAAYRAAEEIVEYDADSKEIATHPNYPVAKCGVVHLRGDGDYAFYEVDAAGTEFNRFLQLIGIYRWVSSEWKKPEPRLVNVPGLARSLESVA